MEGLEHFSTPDRVERYLKEVKEYDPNSEFAKNLAEYILDKRHGKRYDRIDQVLVDIGCGEGTTTSELVAGLGFKKVIAIDGSPYMLELFAKNTKVKLRKVHVETLQVDVTKPLPLNTRSAALVVCIGVTYYLRDFEMLFSEAERILRTNSLFLIDMQTHKGNTLIEDTKQSGLVSFVHPESYVNQLIQKHRLTISRNSKLMPPEKKNGIDVTKKYLFLEKGIN